MARLSGIRECRDKTWYDTHCIEPGQSVKFFGLKNIGDAFRTNMQVPGQMQNGNTYIAFGIGARILGKTREQEDLLLDHLRVELVIGDKRCWDALGPQISMLRHVFLRTELDRLEKESRAFDNESEWTRTPNTAKWKPPPLRIGYHFGRPLRIPSRQNFCVNVSASKNLSETVDMRVHLFGLETRDIQ